MAPTDPTTKRRRFQPPITTFFTTATTTTTTTTTTSGTTPHHTHNHYSTSTSSPTPTLAPKVQASLLSVGMRVRKSIAEGYKTQASFEKSITPTYQQSIHSTAQNPMMMTVTTAADEEGDAFSLPASSQDSMDSCSMSSAEGSRKRGFDDFDFYGCGYEGVDIHSEGWGLIPGANIAGERTILEAKGRSSALRRRFACSATGAAPGEGEFGAVDFEEPAFLRSREEVEGYEYEYEFLGGRCREVEMGGV
ncbi:uncharacterized protein BO97DRAFT_402358 [Aspergillus homomorphus CBS 101889]|uniref:Uncharacterized protein n=1 Tax=Aspergillus homomorphus (strain CBS 101889) TaxID=1450537 RepID=A0A395IEV4_ASPHC|nr:hypothetical protein BO97DRAFT_402358 [Aspergillus homomorphus CBS 101889]RAL16704.1 hypothetical protein BO97DRAFT_402358 [Aspergillus homomorphus CBS 101889]